MKRYAYIEYTGAGDWIHGGRTRRIDRLARTINPISATVGEQGGKRIEVTLYDDGRYEVVVLNDGQRTGESVHEGSIA